MSSDSVAVNPCLSCGACCAHYRCSFYWREADDTTPGGVPVDLTRDLNDTFRAMKVINYQTNRCIALQGSIGVQAHCGIYERRASVCHEFPASYVDGVTPNERCDQARIAHGLSPLRPEDWGSPHVPLRPAA